MKPISILCFVFLFSCTKYDLKENQTAADGKLTFSDKASQKLKPNIILILADDIGYEVPGYTGGQSYFTPNLNRMAAGGLSFSQCHSSPLCSPSRTALITGKYNFRNYFTWGSLPATEKTMANLLSDAGYATCVAGKWQFDGGDASIRKFGFENYCVWDAFKESDEEEDGDIGSMYKNPKVYQNGDFLPQAETEGKYGEDIFCRYVTDFIDSNQTKPFFIYYPMVLCHAPFSPTPDNAAFASWNPAQNKSDTTWFSSMVTYMDKKIGEVIDKVAADGLANRTVIMFAGDNGTPGNIYSWYNGKKIKGGKSKSTEWGTHVPLIAYCPSQISAGSCSDLISFPDFLPTFGNIATTSPANTFGTLDGVSFYNELAGLPATPREWIYNYYNPHPDKYAFNTLIWVQNDEYKLYNGKSKAFYDILDDVYEKSPIPNRNMTPEEKQTKRTFQTIIDSIH